jgi:hypothetical protein
VIFGRYVVQLQSVQGSQVCTTIQIPIGATEPFRAWGKTSVQSLPIALSIDDGVNVGFGEAPLAIVFPNDPLIGALRCRHFNAASFDSLSSIDDDEAYVCRLPGGSCRSA